MSSKSAVNTNFIEIQISTRKLYSLRTWGWPTLAAGCEN